MSQLTTAGRLLADLYREAPRIRDTVASAAGVSIERADGAMNGSLRLSLSEQLRLSEAAALVAPKFVRAAVRLRSQALAAMSFESGALVERHRDAPADHWERSAQMRR